MDMSVAEAILSEKVYSFKEEYSYVKNTKKFGGAHLEYEFFIDVER